MRAKSHLKILNKYINPKYLPYAMVKIWEKFPEVTDSEVI